MRAVHGGSLDLLKQAREPIRQRLSQQAAPRLTEPTEPIEQEGNIENRELLDIPREVAGVADVEIERTALHCGEVLQIRPQNAAREHLDRDLATALLADQLGELLSPQDLRVALVASGGEPEGALLDVGGMPNAHRQQRTQDDEACQITYQRTSAHDLFSLYRLVVHEKRNSKVPAQRARAR